MPTHGLPLFCEGARTGRPRQSLCPGDELTGCCCDALGPFAGEVERRREEEEGRRCSGGACCGQGLKTLWFWRQQQCPCSATRGCCCVHFFRPMSSPGDVGDLKPPSNIFGVRFELCHRREGVFFSQSPARQIPVCRFRTVVPRRDVCCWWRLDTSTSSSTLPSWMACMEPASLRCWRAFGAEPRRRRRRTAAAITHVERPKRAPRTPECRPGLRRRVNIVSQ